MRRSSRFSSRKRASSPNQSPQVALNRSRNIRYSASLSVSVVSNDTSRLRRRERAQQRVAYELVALGREPRVQLRHGGGGALRGQLAGGARAHRPGGVREEGQELRRERGAAVRSDAGDGALD